MKTGVIKGTRGFVIDNSGAIEAEVFGILGGTNKRSSGVGEIVNLAIKQVKPNTSIKKGDTRYGIITTSKYPLQRKDGTVIRANMTSFILLNNSKDEVLGTRVSEKIYVPREVLERNKNVKKLQSLFKEVI